MSWFKRDPGVNWFNSNALHNALNVTITVLCALEVFDWSAFYSTETAVKIVGGLSLAKLLYTFSRLSIRMVTEPGGRRTTMYLRGTATFLPVSPVVFVALAQGISACERLSDAIRTGPLAVDRRGTAFQQDGAIDITRGPGWQQAGREQVAFARRKQA